MNRSTPIASDVDAAVRRLLAQASIEIAARDLGEAAELARARQVFIP